jgi:hypothetical protein
LIDIRIPITTPLRAAIAAVAFCTSLIMGCNISEPTEGAPHPPSQPQAQPPAPPAPPPPIEGASIAGFVADESGGCIVGARVQVVDGPKAGAEYTQTRCFSWDFEEVGFYFTGLPSTVPVTLRASAAGFKTADATLTPTRTTDDAIIVLTKE